MKLYHRRGPSFSGNVLYPLNQLRDVNAEMFELHYAKYRGREALCRVRIPRLDCLWNDVLHFSPVHPAEVRDLARANNLIWRESEWFEIDPLDMGFNAANSLVFLNTDIEPPGYNFPEEQFAPFEIDRVSALTTIPHATDAYYAQSRGANYFIFAGIPHILHKGALDVTDVPRILA